MISKDITGDPTDEASSVDVGEREQVKLLNASLNAPVFDHKTNEFFVAEASGRLGMYDQEGSRREGTAMYFDDELEPERSMTEAGVPSSKQSFMVFNGQADSWSLLRFVKSNWNKSISLSPSGKLAFVSFSRPLFLHEQTEQEGWRTY